MEEQKIYRCAIYTRKSHEDGLEQEFNSLDAQREAAENFIASQVARNWQILPKHYDDGGFSGGNMERPALKQLLADVKEGLIDIIVVYKIDRLSRSLLDFMKLVEMLEEHNVSFVAVTQDINTSSSAGRMMLNILMTFAQYEREVIAERTRDKIAASKRRGKHCGGCPVLGYDADPDTKKLHINPEEAKLVKHIFNRYCELASAKSVARELNEQGFHTKTWKTRKGAIHQGGKFKPDTIYRTLKNQLYIGEVFYRGKTYKGEHEAIIDRKLWNKAKKVTEAMCRVTGFTKRTSESPFKGMLKCGHCGGSFGITYSQKKDRRYTYYICMSNDKKTVRECPIVRIPAGEVDKVILQQLSAVFRTPSILARIYKEAGKIESKQKKSLIEENAKLKIKLDGLRQKINDVVKASSNNPEFTFLLQEFKETEKIFNENQKRIDAIQDDSIGNNYICEAFNSIDLLWDELFPAERYRLAHLLIKKVTIFQDSIQIELKTSGIDSLVWEISDIIGKEAKCDIPKQNNKNVSTVKPEIQPDGDIILTIPITIRHKNGRKLIIAPQALDGEIPDAESPVKEPIARALARAHTWHKLFELGEVKSVVQLAEKLNLHRSYVGRILRMVNLAPDIQEAIFNGDEPQNITLEALKYTIPADWEEQRQIFGVN